MKFFLVNCFCTASMSSGNPAAVFTNFKITDSDKLAIAKRMELPVTVFITDTEQAIPELHFFYPSAEMPLCLHGTLAAAEVLFNAKKVNKITCKIRSGKLLNITKNDSNIIQVKVAAQEFMDKAINPNIIKTMLNLADINLLADDLPCSVFSVGSPKLLIPVKSVETLKKLKPNFDFIKEWSIANNVNGLYVYTRQTNNNFIARGFNPKTGFNEDAATGVAAAALALALKENINVKQGDFIETPCSISVSYKNDRQILVGGEALLDSTLEVPAEISAMLNKKIFS